MKHANTRNQVLRANVGTEPEWSSAIPNLNSFVSFAPSLFERFSITGKIPEHPLLANNDIGDTTDGPSSPSSNNANGATNGERGTGKGDEGGDDPRGSPGARSVRSPGFPPHWLGPGSGGGGGGRRRASSSVGKPTALRDESKNSSGSGSGGGKGIGLNSNNAQRSSVDGSTFVASPPRRSRSKSVAVVSVRNAHGRKSPVKSPGRVSKSKERSRDRDADTTAASGATTTTHTKSAADVPAVPTSTGGGGDEKAAETSCSLSSPPRLPV